MRILFVSHNRLGDAVLSTGLLGHLARQENARITVACGPLPAPLMAAAPGVVEVIPFAKRSYSRHWFALWRRVVGTRWDLLVDLRDSAMAWTVPARRRARYPGARDDEHRVVGLARTLGLEDAPPAPTITVPDAAAEAARLLPPGRPVLAVGPTANWRGKTWRAERFAELIGRMTAAGGLLPGAAVAIVGAAPEREAAAPVLQAIDPSRRIDLVGTVSLPITAGCLARAALYVGNDSGLMHVAAAVGAPTLGLFGPSRPEHYAPWGPRGAWVRTAKSYDELVGGPGYDHRTTDTLMDSLTVDAVEAAAAELWQRVCRAA